MTTSLMEDTNTFISRGEFEAFERRNDEQFRDLRSGVDAMGRDLARKIEGLAESRSVKWAPIMAFAGLVITLVTTITAGIGWGVLTYIQGVDKEAASNTAWRQQAAVDQSKTDSRQTVELERIRAELDDHEERTRVLERAK